MGNWERGDPGVEERERSLVQLLSLPPFTNHGLATLLPPRERTCYTEYMCLGTYVPSLAGAMGVYERRMIMADLQA